MDSALSPDLPQTRGTSPISGIGKKNSSKLPCGLIRPPAHCPINGFTLLVGSFAVATLSYAAFSTIILTLPADLYPAGSVATVSGLSGTGAGIGTIAATFVIGMISDHYSFRPILVGASIVPVLAAALILLLIRKNAATQKT